MNNINTSFNVSNNNLTVFNNNRNNNTLEKGEIISGEIVMRDDKETTVKTENFTFTLPNENIKGELGEKVNFEVLQNNEEGLKLKQLGNDSFEATMQNIKKKVDSDELMELFKQSNFVKDTESKEDKEAIIREKMMLNKINRAMRYGDKNVSKNAIRQLQSKGMNVDKISMTKFAELSSKMSDVVEKDMSEDEIKSFKQNLEKKGISGKELETKSKIADLLNDNGVEVSTKNIDTVFDNLKTIRSIQKDSDKIDVKNLLQGEKTLSVENVLSSFTNGATMAECEISQEIIEAITNRLAQVSEVTPENISIGKMFVANDIPLTGENIDKYNFLTNQLANIENDDIMNALVGALSGDIDLNNVNIQSIVGDGIDVDILESIINNIKDVNIGDDVFELINKNDLELNIKNILKIANGQNVEQAIQQQTAEDTNFNINSQKRLFAEIQLKMTLDSARTMARNGIDINTAPLQQVVEELRKVENEFAKNILQSIEANVNNSMVDNFNDTINSVKAIDLQDAGVMGSIIRNEVGFNLKDMANISTTRKIENLYDQSNTVPNPKFKDSFAKVKELVAPLIENLDMAVTDRSVQAGSILVKNDMDVTRENVENVMTVTDKLQTIKDKLTPEIVGTMLKEGFNPLMEGVEDILSYVDVYNESNGFCNNDKLIDSLIKMDKDKSIDEETAKSIKAVYRALNQIDKYGIASVGSLLKAERDLTLNNLLESAKYYGKTGGRSEVMDISIADEEFKKSAVSNNTIKSVIEQGVERNKVAMDIQNLIDNSDYSSLKEYMNITDDAMNQVLDIVNQRLVEIKEQSFIQPDISQVVEMTKQLFNTNSEVVEYLFNNDIKLNNKNISNVKKLDENLNTSAKNIKNMDIELNIPSQLNENISLQDNIGQVFDAVIGEVESVPVEDMITQTETIDLLNMQKYLSKNSKNFMSMPMKLDSTGELTNLNMFMLDKNALAKDEVTILLSLYTETLKEVTANVEINKDTKEVNIEVGCEAFALEVLKQEEQNFADNLRELGFDNINMNYRTNSTPMSLFNAMKG